MKIVEQVDATRSLADYATNLGGDPVIIVHQGQPVAALVPIEDVDLESVTISTNAEFIELIERSRNRARTEGAISSEEMRRRFG